MIFTDCLRMEKEKRKGLRISVSDDFRFLIQSRQVLVITKIARYLDPSNTGDWKNVICITADDEDGNTHMSDAEGLAIIT